MRLAAKKPARINGERGHTIAVRSSPLHAALRLSLLTLATAYSADPSLGAVARKTTWHVKADAAPARPFGKGHEVYAFPTIQEAIDVASSGDTIVVAPGTYAESIDFSGKRISLIGLVGPKETTIVGSVVCDGGETAGTRLSGFTLTPDGADSALYVGNCDLDVRNIAFVGRGRRRGAEIRGSAHFAACTFVRHSTNFGGAIITGVGSVATIDNCVFASNVANYGGAIESAGELTISRSVFVANHAPHAFMTDLSGAGGAISHTGASMTIVNCRFEGNVAEGYGGAIDTASGAAIFGTLFLDNVAEYGGGGVSSAFGDPTMPVLVSNSTFLGNASGSQLGSAGSAVSAGGLFLLENTVVWKNGHPFGAIDANVQVTSSNIQGGILSGLATMDLDPVFAADGHLAAGSPCIDAGSGIVLGLDVLDLDEDGNSAEPLPYDLDGDTWLGATLLSRAQFRVSAVDIGADQFIDSDGDRLPNWWEVKYFADVSGAEAGDDVDGDGLSNLDEYELYGGDPTSEPYFVSATAGDDAYDGRAPGPTGGIRGPKRTIQAALNSARRGDSVLVFAGTYSGVGNRGLDFASKSIVLKAASREFPPPTIDCGHISGALAPLGSQASFSSLQGFGIRNCGQPDISALELVHSRFMFKDCSVLDTQVYGMRFRRSNVILDEVRIGATMPDSEWRGMIEDSAVEVHADLRVGQGRLDVLSSWVSGSGRIVLENGAILRIGRRLQYPPFVVSRPTVVRCDVSGAGGIQIDAGEQLIVSGDAIVDLGTSGSCNPEPTPPNGNGIVVEGSLVIEDAAVIRNTNVQVKVLELDTSEAVVNNNITLLEASTGFGGEFFVKDSATIDCNTIVSEGDRYLDLDPDPAAKERPKITNNRIYVRIKQGAHANQGTLLELRALDYDCGKRNNPNCASGAWPAQGSDGFTADPSQNWVLEELEILPDAKLNLTNRQGFDFQEASLEETVYVKRLILHPNAVLNTALQTLYYQDLILVDETQSETPWLVGPPFPGTFPNGARIVDVPLLGFSLGIIAMDDVTPSPHNEFDIRVRTRIRDTRDPQPEYAPFKEGSTQRMQNTRFGGVMMMSTRAPGAESASSVAAKGAFARAGDEEITIAFEYLWLDNGLADDGELIVYLSDSPEVGDDLLEVARLRPPATGRAGAVGTERLATFLGTFSRRDLNFGRGTYVELELRGDRSAILIDRWDPQVICSSTCADLDGGDDVTGRDFLLLLAELGQVVDPFAPDGKGCLDSSVSRDFYTDYDDLSAWDAWLNGSNLDACGAAPSSAAAAQDGAPIRVPPSGSLLISGKSNEAGVQDDFLFSITPEGNCVCDRQSPSSASLQGAGHRSNGRLMKDASGHLYQLHATQGLVRLDSAETIVEPHLFKNLSFASAANVDVQVGVQPVGTGEQGVSFRGLPLSDAVFHPFDDTLVYVVPVVVAPADGSCPYRAAAKLKLLNGGMYAPLELYGWNPELDPTGVDVERVLGCEFLLLEPDKQHLREIEIDALGNVYVISAHSQNGNDWLLIYDEAVGSSSERPIPLSFLGTPIESPAALAVGSLGDRLYLTSSINQTAATRVFRFEINRSGDEAVGVTPDGVIEIDNSAALANDLGFGFRATVTAVTEGPEAGSLYVIGFTMPRFDPDLPANDRRFDAVTGSIFTTPTLTIVAPDSWLRSRSAAAPPPAASVIRCHQLALPLSAVVVADHSTPHCVSDLADVAAFVNCFSGDSKWPNFRTPTEDCAMRFDVDSDSDIDLNDYTSFSSALTGR